jgi:hypothetical protein
LFIAALFITPGKREQPRCPHLRNALTEYGLFIQQNILATKRNEVHMHSTTAINFENMLHDTIQSQESTYYAVSFI